MNCSTIAFIYDYIKTGVPLIKRRLTVDGNIVNKPMNLIVPVGTPIDDILAAANVYKKPDRVLLGGPMMGSCLINLDTPVTKTSNSFLAIKDYKEPEKSACIRCGRCIRACPLNLMPTELEKAYIKKNISALESLKVMLCMNCGSCTYVCPANRRLAETNQLAKALIPKKK